METKPESLYEALLAYGGTDAYPFHMPGHKRRLGSMADPFSFDITEIEGFDNLHHPEGILKEAQERAAALYGAKEAFYLVNGSTAGILAGISAAIRAGMRREDTKDREIIFARNAHKSAFHALYLNRISPVWLYPGSVPAGDPLSPALMNGRVDPARVKELLEEHPRTAAVFITSPTYDGVVSDVAAIARIAHAAGVSLVVDQAHGAHFGLHPDLPESASRLGADIVITSLHKTLPSLTQTGLLLLGGDLIRPESVRRFLSVYQTSSPSYVLMAGMDECVRMMQRNGREVFDGVLACVKNLGESSRAWRHVKLTRTDDPTKILISAGAGLSGRGICDILRNHFHIEAEMTLPGYVLCLAGAGDDPSGFDRLAQALSWIDERICDGTCPGEDSAKGAGEQEAGARGDMAAGAKALRLQERIAQVICGEMPCETAMPLDEAWDGACGSEALNSSAGLISGDFAYLYPPGIPLVIPGERIRPEIAALLGEAGGAGYEINGMADLAGERIRVLSRQMEAARRD